MAAACRNARGGRGGRPATHGEAWPHEGAGEPTRRALRSRDPGKEERPPPAGSHLKERGCPRAQGPPQEEQEPERELLQHASAPPRLLPARPSPGATPHRRRKGLAGKGRKVQGLTPAQGSGEGKELVQRVVAQKAHVSLPRQPAAPRGCCRHPLSCQNRPPLPPRLRPLPSAGGKEEWEATGAEGGTAGGGGTVEGKEDAGGTALKTGGAAFVTGKEGFPGNGLWALQDIAQAEFG